MNKKHNNQNEKLILNLDEKYNIISEYLSNPKMPEKKIKSRTTYNGYPIGQWQAYLRKLYYKGELNINPELETKFLELGVLRKEKERENSKPMSWESKYIIMQEYLSKGGKIKDSTVYNGHKIGEWQRVLRHLFYTDKLTNVTPELKKKFFAEGILSKENRQTRGKGAIKTSYEEKFKIMYQYLKENDFETDIKQNTVFNGYKIGSWQDNLRQTYRKGRDIELTPELRDKFFTYGILRQSDTYIRKQKNINNNLEEKKKQNKTKDNNDIEYMLDMLLKKQQKIKKLNEEVAELQKRIDEKKENQR